MTQSHSEQTLKSNLLLAPRRMRARRHVFDFRILVYLHLKFRSIFWQFDAWEQSVLKESLKLRQKPFTQPKTLF
jgi:hypothetical protein